MSTQMESPAIRIVELRKTYRVFRDLKVGRGSAVAFSNFFKKITGMGGKRVVALDGVNLEVRRGEVFGLLGPNGAGKTTMIKILSTLVLPDSGKAYVEGVDVTRRPRETVRRLQTVLSESIGFEKRLSGKENLEFFSALLGMPRKAAKQRISELLEFTGMKDWSGVMFQRYSTGMARRLLVCRALLSDASVLLFDEPTAALDPMSAAEFRRLIRQDLAEGKGKTILLATHNLWEAEQLCDRIALLRKGKIIAIGTPDEIKSRVSDRINLSLVVSSILPGAVSEVKVTLGSVRGVLNVDVNENGDESGHSRLDIEAAKNLNYNEVFQRLSLMKVEVVSLEASQPSLEDAFMKLNLEATG